MPWQRDHRRIFEQHQHRLFSLRERRRVLDAAQVNVYFIGAQSIGKLVNARRLRHGHESGPADERSGQRCFS